MRAEGCVISVNQVASYGWLETDRGGYHRTESAKCYKSGFLIPLEKAVKHLPAHHLLES